uniref:Uncharacterized protein n=1 Tax=Faecalibaculum rodentium TaxID=1702221 RepID=A0A140DTS2_9FIRM|nr:hypothetical protein AALO17_09150 [Faecalibaculum rodentium]
MLLLQGEFIPLSRIGVSPSADSLSGGKEVLCPVNALIHQPEEPDPIQAFLAY